MEEKKISIEISVYKNKEQLEPTYLQLVEQAEQATYQAYAPYSNFCVGAAILLANGKTITGSNQENAAYPSGLCAERTAIFYAGSQFPNETIVAIAVAARKADTDTFLKISPCGACRQVLLEYESRQQSKIVFLMQGNDSSFLHIHAVADLLPFNFNQDSLYL